MTAPRDGQPLPPSLAMSLEMHEISEADHRILNPFTDEKLMLVGR